MFERNYLIGMCCGMFCAETLTGVWIWNLSLPMSMFKGLICILFLIAINWIGGKITKV